jgi:arginyl-tRNA synthetase
LKEQLVDLIRRGIAALPPGVLPAEVRDPLVELERTRDAAHGDFASSIALKLAKVARRKPRELAEAIVAALPSSPLVTRAEVAGAGFINLHLSPAAYAGELQRIAREAAGYGRSNLGHGRRVLVEFVSSNPTGPLHVGHGRHAAYGASLAGLLETAGFAVECEYYVNDAGRQMDILAASVWLRYLESCGEQFPFPSNGYRGEYLRPIAEKLRAAEQRRLQRRASEVFSGLPPDAPAGDQDPLDALIERARTLLGAADFRKVLDAALADILADIRDDLAGFGVIFDRWFSERSLSDDGAIDRALTRLKASGHVYSKDGALWFKATDYGDEKDRVVERENGQRTYFASDIAYHLHKRERGFELLIDVLGADHHGYVARVRAGLEAMGEPGDSLEVRLIQFVTLYRGGEKVQMSTRSGEFITLRELRNEVGNDAARFFYVMRSNDQHLDFDLELAKSRSNDNPVYYIQYAHARVASVMKQLHERNLAYDAAEAAASFGLLDAAEEVALLRSLTQYPEILQSAAIGRAPHLVVHYLRDLANDFHSYYNAHQFIVADSRLRNARLMLVLALQQVVRNGLRLLGVSAPDSM